MTPPPHRGRRPRFTSDDAVRAALVLGISDFSMSRVADNLGVTTPALYRHFSTREELTVACLVAVGREQPEPPADLSWDGYLTFLAERLWSALLDHPGLDEVMSTLSRSLSQAMDPTGRMIRGLLDQGFSFSRIIFATQYLADLATSSVAQLQRQLTRTGPGPEADSLRRSFHRGYRAQVDFFLDSLTALAPDFPEMTGPVGVPTHERQPQP